MFKFLFKVIVRPLGYFELLIGLKTNCCTILVRFFLSSFVQLVEISQVLDTDH